jgi:transcription initiation factor IIF auxiliary subunit
MTKMLTNGTSTVSFSVRHIWRVYNREPDQTISGLQSKERHGVEGWYWWKIFIEGPLVYMSKIRSVTYYLHPTFSPNEITVSDSQTGFALESLGWGEFDVFLDFRFQNGMIIRGIKHYLDLLTDNPKPDEVKVEMSYLS